jgi:hypothetical protein
MWTKFIISVSLIFLLTLKFEFVNNIILIFVFLAIKEKFKFSTSIVMFLVLTALYFIPFYLVHLNEIYFKYILYIFRLLMILFVIKVIFSGVSMRGILDKSLKLIYYTHVGAILLCFLSPQLNSVFRNLFSYSTGSEFRISGFIQGYDFVPFIILIYLAYEFRINGEKLTKGFLFNLFFGSIAIFFSGRFGLIPLGFFLFFVFIKSFDLFKFGFLISFGVAFSVFFQDLFQDRFENILNTSNLMYEMLTDIENIDFARYGEIKIDGQYNLSPLSFYNEFLKPFKNWDSHIFPGSQEFVDSGPSFMALNLGFFVTVIFYMLYFKVINFSSGAIVPISIVIIVLLIDLKFRSLYSLTPAIWLIVNHANYKYQKTV